MLPQVQQDLCGCVLEQQEADVRAAPDAAHDVVGPGVRRVVPRAAGGVLVVMLVGLDRAGVAGSMVCGVGFRFVCLFGCEDGVRRSHGALNMGRGRGGLHVMATCTPSCWEMAADMAHAHTMLHHTPMCHTQTKRDDETADEFASRVQQMIADAAGGCSSGPASMQEKG